MALGLFVRTAFSDDSENQRRWTNSTARIWDARGPSRIPLSPTGTVLLAIALGLCGGYLDLVVIVYRKYFWNDLRYFWSGSDFPWSVPVVHAVLLASCGCVRGRSSTGSGRGRITLRTAAWLFATLAIWAALLRMPLYGVCTLLLAAGLGRPISTAVVSLHPAPAACAARLLAGLLGLLIVLAALSSGRQAIRRYRARTALPAPPPGARNVLLIVWDTVRASNLSLYGYPRNTTPTSWSGPGRASVTPWLWRQPPGRIPRIAVSSPASGLTSLIPSGITPLTPSYPTLAEYLASRGYQTVGFAANTRCCSYETGLDRGFAHYRGLSADASIPPGPHGSRKLDPQEHHRIAAISTTPSGSTSNPGMRTGSTTPSSGLAATRAARSPLFRLPQLFDAHDPYVPPAEYAGRFGIRPKTQGITVPVRLSVTYRKEQKQIRNIFMARDCYDDCIAFLDDQLGRLLDELRGRGCWTTRW